MSDRGDGGLLLRQKSVWSMGFAAASGSSDGATRPESLNHLCDGEAFQGNHYEEGLEVFEAVGKRRTSRPGHRVW